MKLLDTKKAFIKAAFNGDYDTIVSMLKNKIDINIKYWGCTALYWASWKAHINIINLLLDHGANINCQNGIGNTPLLIGAYNGNKEVVELLLERGANPEQKNIDGELALTFAIEYGFDIIRDLLRQKIDEIIQIEIKDAQTLKSEVNAAVIAWKKINKEDNIKALDKLLGNKRIREDEITEPQNKKTTPYNKQEYSPPFDKIGEYLKLNLKSKPTITEVSNLPLEKLFPDLPFEDVGNIYSDLEESTDTIGYLGDTDSDTY